MSDNPRRLDGGETWHRLLNWDKGQTASERLASSLLTAEGFNVDPSHPLGGKDGGKDSICKKDGLRLVGAAYFPRGQRTVTDILGKFSSDLEGVKRNGAAGIVFVCNQELKLGERKQLIDAAGDEVIELYHLERLTTLLNTPKHYGLRLEFLGITVSPDEYLALIATRDEEHYERLNRINGSIEALLEQIKKQATDLAGYSTGAGSQVVCDAAVWGGGVVALMLRNSSKYPAFDISCEWIDCNEAVDFEANQDWTRHRKFVPHLYPERVLMNLFQFNLAPSEVLRINLFINTRSSGTIQEFKFARVDDRVLIAHRTNPPESLEMQIPVEFPGYDPKNPKSIFD